MMEAEMSKGEGDNAPRGPPRISAVGGRGGCPGSRRTVSTQKEQYLMQTIQGEEAFTLMDFLKDREIGDNFVMKVVD